MAGRFESFVILGAMRTGSNYLEASLNEIDGVTSFGEMFNPHFIGRYGQTEFAGVSLRARDADPHLLLRRMKAEAGGLPGFRFFRDHDPRVFDAVIADPSCAKIVLTRNPVDSFVSLRIAAETGQWMLQSEKRRRTAKIHFDVQAYEAYREALEAFYKQVRVRLRTSGQTFFEVDYSELSDVAILNGLAKWLGAEGRLKRPSRRILRQNPVALADRVLNPEDVPQAPSGGYRDADRQGLVEPSRGAAVPTYVAAANAPLIYLPIKGGPTGRVEAWLAALDGLTPDNLLRNFKRRSLRDWHAKRTGFRSFTVISHPLERAHRTFLIYILSTAPEAYLIIREKLRTDFGISLPAGPPDEGYSSAQHKDAFLGFLKFVKANLAGQTSVRNDAAWATQDTVVRGFADLRTPDLLIREDRLAEGLSQIAAQIDRASPELIQIESTSHPVTLGDIYDEEVEAMARSVYSRDYLAFGFSNWSGSKRP